MGLIRSLFWFAIFLAATFTFTVIFEHGFDNFNANAKKEFDTLKGYVSGGGSLTRQPDKSDKLP
jgi:hypothetical protein